MTQKTLATSRSSLATPQKCSCSSVGSKNTKDENHVLNALKVEADWFIAIQIISALKTNMSFLQSGVKPLLESTIH